MKNIDLNNLFMGMAVLSIVFGVGYLTNKKMELIHAENMAEIEQQCEPKEHPHD